MRVFGRTVLGICAIAAVFTAAMPLFGAGAERLTAEVVAVDAESRTLILRGMDGRITTYAADAGFLGRLEAGEMIGYEAADGHVVTIVRVGTKPRPELE